MFGFIKKTLSNIYTQVTTKLQGIFAKKSLDQSDMDELFQILYQADTGVKTTKMVVDELNQQYQAGLIADGSDLKRALQQQLAVMLPEISVKPADIYLLVGINGSGKTTCAAKLAYKFQQEGKKVLFAAADTFRAAAVQQLQEWANKLDITMVTGKEDGDPAAVVYSACEQFASGNWDVLIIDTAGRLQTKVNLMKELEKINRVIERKVGDKKRVTLLTVDSMLGQNSFEQAKLFHESTPIDGIILTKMDGTGKGGIVFAINQELKIPVWFISFGEQMQQLKQFNAEEYLEDLLA